MISPRIFTLAALGSLSLGAALIAADEPRRAFSVQIDLAAPAKPISPDLFGVFFEDLNFAADGGLYAELLQNRSFEYDATERREWNSFTGWTTAARGAGAGNVAVRSAKPLHPNNPHYVSIDAKTPGDGFGVANDGFDGVPLRAGEGYELSFFAHQLFMGEPWTADNDIVGRPMPVTVQLEAANGEILAEASVTITGRDWTRHAVRLVSSRAEPRARVVVLARAKGGIALDEISLFPEQTFRHRKNGLRADLAQAIADLKPRFIRFPGGCLAHGDGVNNFYRWKDTIGPIEQRRGQRNLWGYHQSVGLGYFEFFQFCEDIGAKPLPVVPAGVSCQNSNFSPGHGQQCLPLEELPAYIQELCDLIEWANGPATSRWGALRAAAGHPEPFGLRYLGVGNEDAITPGFEERFRLIQQALRERHPEIVLIGTVGPAPDGTDFERGWAFARAEHVPVVDEHYYRSPDWFWENLHRYDSYDRNGPKVYVGEYAAHETDRRNTLRSALAEAAGCIGFERNGDVVVLSSYAPLLARRGHTQWTPDMIYFTGTDVFPSLNYQVQRLFGQNAGDALLSATSEDLPAGRRVAFSAVRDSASGDVIVKLVNAEDRAVSAALSLAGAAAGERRLVATVLTGASADVANDDTQPPAALPRTEESRVGARFERLLPAHSLTVLRLR
ncbi:MAG: alpha-L-arabinofuranosidase C-terminal domain-containing protein [Opitutaceae bacterium]